MKFENLCEDPESESPYAESLVLDSGGMTVKVWDEDVNVSFEGLDPFEIAFHAVPDDWEPHPEWEPQDGDGQITVLPLSQVELAENAVNRALLHLGNVRGWERA